MRNASSFTAIAASAIFAAGALADAPLFFGNTDIAAKIETGEGHVLLVGDSLQNLMARQYLRRWPIDKFSGQTVSENPGYDTGAFTENLFTPPFVSAKAGVLADDI